MTTTDPVCGMTVQDISAAPRAAHAGRDYAFCSTACRDRFTNDPGRYARTGSGTGA